MRREREPALGDGRRASQRSPRAAQEPRAEHPSAAAGAFLRRRRCFCGLESVAAQRMSRRRNLWVLRATRTPSPGLLSGGRRKTTARVLQAASSRINLRHESINAPYTRALNFWEHPHQRSPPRHGFAGSNAQLARTARKKAPAAPAIKQSDGDARPIATAPDFKKAPPLERFLG